MEPIQSEETKGKEPEVIDDPVEFTNRFLQSDTLNEEFEKFKQRNPINPEQVVELPNSEPATLENYQKFRLLLNHGEDLVHNFSAFEGVKLGVKADAFSSEVNGAIKEYVSAVKDVNKAAGNVDPDRLAIYSYQRRECHIAAGNAVAKFLTEKGALPKDPFGGDDPRELTNYGRGIVSLIVQARHPQINKIYGVN